MELPAKSKAAVEPQDMEPSPALRIVGKYPATLAGRAVGILVTDGADGGVVEAVRKAARGRGRQRQDRRAEGRRRDAEGRQQARGRRPAAGTPSVLFDAVALVVSEEGCASCSARAPPWTSSTTPSCT